MLVSTLCPTYNRMPHLRHLLEEAVECFLRQDYPDKELLICNDTPGQRLSINHPQIKVFNLEERMPTLTGKISYLIEQAQGEVLCRWDDDDIHLPHRLSYSVAQLGGSFEWHPDRHWYMEGLEVKKLTLSPGNTHTMAVWHRDLLPMIGGYPKGLSGNEDQVFNQMLLKYGINGGNRPIPNDKVFYIYRWSTGSRHLSGMGGGPHWNPHQAHYDALGRLPSVSGLFTIRPHWRRDYVRIVDEALKKWEDGDFEN
jgi:glycosyltransferase involved in cell wall biosynthesis